jgi:hypothetical protein
VVRLEAGNEAVKEFVTQGSRGGNPGLEVGTRFAVLDQRFLQSVIFEETRVCH